MAEKTKSDEEKYFSILASKIKEPIRESRELNLGLVFDFIEMISCSKPSSQTREKKQFMYYIFQQSMCEDTFLAQMGTARFLESSSRE